MILFYLLEFSPILPKTKEESYKLI
jgi:hypothetical protein